MWRGASFTATCVVLLTCGTCVRLDVQDASEVKTLNCERPLGALVLNTGDAQNALNKWRSLPAEPWIDLPPNPVFIMLVYTQIAFPQAWEAVFNTSELQHSFKLLVHAKDQVAQESLPPFFKSRFVANFQQTRRCSAVKLILNLLDLCLKARQQASHFVILSGDSMPTKPLAHMLKDLEMESRSRFCVDSELLRAETFFAMRRDLASFFVKNFETLFSQIVQATSCPDEDMFFWAAYQRGEGTVNSCIQMSDWSNTDKVWKSNAERCDCPKFLSSGRLKLASCARPSLWGAITRAGLNDIFESPAGYWLIRKFPGDKVPGRTLLLDGPNQDEVLAQWLEMHDNAERSRSVLDTYDGADDGFRPKTLKGALQEGESLDFVVARLIVERRMRPHIPLLIIPDPEADALQAVRKFVDGGDSENPDLSGFPLWTTFNRISTSGLAFAKTIGMLVTAFD
eukprot:TRINITY_DN5976_c0_g3_i1.p1 TRINITY_DN5976_c0_g3~~TRINITY_DN5976_c0_g3_i1.p1  ORF type:complete len:454 (-),score=59.43 TRINITY_DN5976_c0_g3_i1:77-1438(-)